MSRNDNPRPHITFWGTRGSISTPGRTTEKYGGNTSCVNIKYKDTNIILDAGTGIRNLGLSLMDENSAVNKKLILSLFLSHTHWDHIQGFPFFQPAYRKDTDITILGSPNKTRSFDSILNNQMDPVYFPVEMLTFSADIKIQEIAKKIIQLNEVTVDWQEQVFHPSGSVRYRLNFNGKKVVYATDVELDRFFRPDLASKESDDMAQEYLDFIHNADLLIADGQYTEEEYQNKKGWGHTSIPVLIDVAYKARVKKLAIFHHEPQHTDKFLDSLWMRYQSILKSAYQNMDIFWAREGLTLAV